jgi:hypothetical protein
MQTNGFTLTVTDEIDAFIERIDAYQGENVPFVTAFALTKTAQDIKDEAIVLMAKEFDRPTRFTLNALQVKPATKRDLTAIVSFKEGFGSVPAWRYLGPQVEGGLRSHKSFELRLIRAGIMRSNEFAVPGGGAQLDGSGNIPGGKIELMLSQLGAAEQFSGYQANATARSNKRKLYRGAWFAMRDVKGAPDGVYVRTGGRTAKPFILFVVQPRYRKRFPFYEIAKRVFQDRFAKNFSIGWARYGSQVRPQ